MTTWVVGGGLWVVVVLLVWLNLQTWLANSHRVEILEKRNRQWVHVKWLREGHPGITEALDAPGWAVRFKDGRVEAGRQV